MQVNQQQEMQLRTLRFIPPPTFMAGWVMGLVLSGTCFAIALLSEQHEADVRDQRRQDEIQSITNSLGVCAQDELRAMTQNKQMSTELQGAKNQIAELIWKGSSKK